MLADEGSEEGSLNINVIEVTGLFHIVCMQASEFRITLFQFNLSSVEKPRENFFVACKAARHQDSDQPICLQMADFRPP